MGQRISRSVKSKRNSRRIESISKSRPISQVISKTDINHVANYELLQNLSALPRELIVVNILHYLSWHDLGTLRLVCRFFRDELLNDFRCWKQEVPFNELIAYSDNCKDLGLKVSQYLEIFQHLFIIFFDSR